MAGSKRRGGEKITAFWYECSKRMHSIEKRVQGEFEVSLSFDTCSYCSGIIKSPSPRFTSSLLDLEFSGQV